MVRPAILVTVTVLELVLESFAPSSPPTSSPRPADGIGSPVIATGQRSRATQTAGPVVRLQNLHDLLAALQCRPLASPNFDQEESQRQHAATAPRRHGTSGEHPCPSVWRFHDRQRGDQLTARGQISMSDVRPARCIEPLGVVRRRETVMIRFRSGRSTTRRRAEIGESSPAAGLNRGRWRAG